MNPVEALLFFLPAGIGNMMPIFSNKIPLLNRWKTPIDFGKNFRGIRILGNNKTWRGIITGTLAGGLSGLLIKELAPSVPSIGFIAGCLLGLGALSGDAVESFFKRQRNIPPGSSWFPFDQTDYIIGGLVFVLPFADVELPNAAIILLTYFGLHILISYIGFLLKLKDKPI